jgi:hypothetical protein
MKSIWRAWVRCSNVLGRIILTLLMAVLYFIVFLPIGIGIRIFGDPLNTKKQAGDSFWKKRAPLSDTLDSVRKQS